MRYLSLFSRFYISTNYPQGITKGFTESGFKTQTQDLSTFYDAYGLQANEDDEDEDEDEGSGDGSDEGEEDDDSNDDEMED